MSEFTRKQLRDLRKDEKAFDSVGLSWLAKVSRKEYDILEDKVKTKQIN